MSLRECVRRKRALLKERKLCGHGSDKMAGAHRPSHNTLFRFRGTADAHATQTRDSGVGVKCHLSKCRFDSLSHLASHRFNDSWPSRVEQFDAALLERWRGRTRGEEKAQPWRTVDNRLNLIRYLYIYIYTYYIHSIQSNNRKRRIRMYRRGFFFSSPQWMNGWFLSAAVLNCHLAASLCKRTMSNAGAFEHGIWIIYIFWPVRGALFNAPRGKFSIVIGSTFFFSFSFCIMSGTLASAF